MENPDRSATMITVSDRSAEGTREDVSGPLGARLLEEAGWEVTGVVVPDDRDAIAGAILTAVDGGAALVVTTGGTGLGPRDVTPEATGPLLDRPIPGIAERLRAIVADRLPASMLSRGLAGLRGPHARGEPRRLPRRRGGRHARDPLGRLPRGRPGARE
jgi:molybdenum cofactor synthesis domain-containing protein